MKNTKPDLLVYTTHSRETHYPVDSYLIIRVVEAHLRGYSLQTPQPPTKEQLETYSWWTPRYQTILDLLLVGV